MSRGRLGGFAPVAALLVLGCAPLAPVMAPPPVAGGATSGATAGAIPGTVQPAAPAPAAHDTLPSPDAERVLAAIPEPLTAEERAVAQTTRDMAAHAPGDSSAASATRPDSTASADSTRGVPTPAPTAPLGDRPGTLARILSPDSALAAPADSAARAARRDSLASARASAAPHPAAGAAAADSRRAAAAARGECFRLQVGAPADKSRAARLKLAAESQLDLAFDVQRSRGLYKVRSRDCMTREAAHHLTARARAAGFKGVFVVAGGAK